MALRVEKVEIFRLRAPTLDPSGLLIMVRLTLSLAGLGDGVHLIAFIAFAFKVPFVVDADLATGVGVFTLVDVCRAAREHG